MATPNLDELSGLVDRLQQLLKNPEPGLFVWREAYAQASLALLQFWGATPAASDLKLALSRLVSTADDSGCTDDLTVVSKSALENLRKLFPQ